MKRLTERNEDGTVFYPYCFQDDTCGGNGASEECGTCAHEIHISERLAAYEDTGLMPEEIMELKDFCRNPLNTAVPAVQAPMWIPVEERLPEKNDYVLMSFDNFSLPLVGRYESDEDGSGAWYLGDRDENDTCVSNDLFVNAWMPLPEPYRTEGENDD